MSSTHLPGSSPPQRAPRFCGLNASAQQQAGRASGGAREVFDGQKSCRDQGHNALRAEVWGLVNCSGSWRNTPPQSATEGDSFSLYHRVRAPHNCQSAPPP